MTKFVIFCFCDLMCMLRDMLFCIIFRVLRPIDIANRVHEIFEMQTNAFIAQIEPSEGFLSPNL